MSEAEIEETIDAFVEAARRCHAAGFDGVDFDEAGGYNQANAEGFIKLNALRLRIAAERDRRTGRND